MDVAFKLADGSDTDLLAELMREYYEFDHLTFDERMARAALQQILNDPALGRVWLIKTDDSPVGYIVLTLGFSLLFGGRDAFIDEFYIGEEHRGRGIGRRTLEFVEEACAAWGAQAIHLEVTRHNTNAQALYRKFGFEDHDHYLMTKWIAG